MSLMTNDPGHYGQPESELPTSPPPADPYSTGWRPAPQPQYGPPVGPPGYPPPQYTPQPYPPAPVQPAAPKKRQPSKVLLGIVAAVTVVCCGGLAIIIGTSKDNTTNPASNTPTTGAAQAAGAGGIPAWYNGGGKTLIDAMSGDFSAISDAGKNTNITAMRTACAKLQSDTEAAQAYKPIPDDQAQQHWAKALALTARSSTDCIAGTSQVNPALITQAGQEMDQATAELQQAAARINTLHG